MCAISIVGIMGVIMGVTLDMNHNAAELGSSTVDQVLKYTKYPKYIPSTSTGQVLIFLKST